MARVASRLPDRYSQLRPMPTSLPKRFGSVYWSQAVVNGNPLGAFQNSNVWLYSRVYNGSPSGNLLASTDANLTNNQNFTVNWQNCT